MIIFNQQGAKEICDIPLNIKSIQDKEIYSDKIHMLIPIQNEEILKAICLEDCSMQSNYNSSDLFLHIDMEDENFNVCLAVTNPKQVHTPARVYTIEMTQEEKDQLMWELVCLI